jgi:hypothetical protein
VKDDTGDRHLPPTRLALEKYAISDLRTCKGMGRCNKKAGVLNVVKKCSTGLIVETNVESAQYFPIC